MSRSFWQSFLAAQKHADSEVVCPTCYFTFWPVVGDDPAFRISPQCPQCGHTFAQTQSVQVEDEENTFGPFERPIDSRIEVKEQNGTRIYKIPSEEIWLPTHVFIIGGNIAASGWLAYLLLSMTLTSENWGRLYPPAFILLCLFPTLLFYLRAVYITHELRLGPRTLQLRRSYILKRNHEVSITAIDGVRRFLDYSGDEGLLKEYGIEITAGWDRIRFPCPASPADTNWLCWDIREFTHQLGAPLALPVLNKSPQFAGVAALAHHKEPGASGPRPGARIERLMKNGNLIYRIPRGRCEIVLLGAAAGFLVIPVLLLGSFLIADTPPSKKVLLQASPFIIVFGGIGIGLIYNALVSGFATYELVLGPRTTRLRRKLIFVKESEVATRAIFGVSSYEVSWKGGKSTRGLKIDATTRTLSIGTVLSVDEQRWLADDIRNFARQHGAKVEADDSAP